MKVESSLSPCQAALLSRFDRAGCTRKQRASKGLVLCPKSLFSVDIYLQSTRGYPTESLNPTCIPTRGKLSIGLDVKLLGADI